MELLDLKTGQTIIIEGEKITEHIKAKWEEIHSNTNVFRYKIENIEERIVDNKYLLQLNKNRAIKRRTPEQIINICQQFDEHKFNFTKVSNNEIMLKFKVENDDDNHTFMVNVSPISRYHTLLCPSIDKCLPQVATKHSLKIMIDLILQGKYQDLRIAFNSLCAMASVNHLHYHFLIEKNILPVEKLKCKQIKGPLYTLENYPAHGFCFEISETSRKIHEIYQLLEFLLQKSIAHNIFVTRGDCVEDQNLDTSGMSIRFVIWPRKSSSGAKQLSAFNVAACELSGWFVVHKTEDFYSLQTEELDEELRKWNVDNFEELCEEVKFLY